METTQRPQTGSRTIIALSKHCLKCSSPVQVFCSLSTRKHSQASAVTRTARCADLLVLLLLLGIGNFQSGGFLSEAL